MAYLNLASCVTHHGPGHLKLFRQLCLPEVGRPLRRQVERPLHLSMTQQMALVFQGLFETHQEQFESLGTKNWGLILASTKGVVEDFIWQETLSPETSFYEPISQAVITHFPYQVKRHLHISNACTSSIGAIQMAQNWLQRNWVDKVLVIAVDFIGPFISKGFESLRALSPNNLAMPFDSKRDGLSLGDALGFALVSSQKTPGALVLSEAQTRCEGGSATRPQKSSQALSRCLTDTLANQPPDVVIAHGTGTQYNDATESSVLSQLFSNTSTPLITASKWSVGHSMGASGLVDLCVAQEILNQQIVPGLPYLQNCDLPIDPLLCRQTQERKVSKVLLSSLGFGGVSAAVCLHSQESPC